MQGAGSGRDPGERPGDRIGRYELLQELGEGGFGVVWMAEQTEPVRRRVALKVIKLGMDTRQVVARFEAERQALALMDHPNIARVLDGGATERGRPYFVMELVHGAPIVEFCDRHRLSIEQRLELMGDVCRAVQHAHSKGIIHRDLKPSNVLVGHQDGRPRVKVIDFGIAKAISRPLTDKTLFTEHRQVIGTLQYMSPEQAAGSLDVDTRTDVYSLGILLYELLTGSTPFDPRTWRGDVYHELQRALQEEVPPKPSTRLSESGEALANLAAQRGVEPRRLGTLLRGELDWIVMRALEKDRTRRYETASGLGEDLRRFLAGEAVEAAPPSAGYRLRTLLRRHRGFVGSAGAVALALLLGLAAFAWQAVQARDQRDRALEAEGEARARADELQRVADFQAGLLERVEAAEAGRHLRQDVLARYAAALGEAAGGAEAEAELERFRADWARVNATDAAVGLIDATILSPAALAVAADFGDQPLVAARLRQVLADCYRHLGLLEAALPLQEEAYATRRAALGDTHPDTLLSQDSRGLLHLARGEYEAAERAARGALRASRQALGDVDPATLDRVTNLATAVAYQGRVAEAEPLYREAFEGRRATSGDDHPETLKAINNLAYLLDVSGRGEEAEPLYREALQGLRRTLGDEHPTTIATLGNLGVFLHVAGRLDEAEPLYREALEGRRRVLGAEHPETLSTLANLGALLKSQGHLAEAEPLYLEALERRREALGPDHPDTLISLNNLAGLVWAQGDLARAEGLYQETLQRKRRRLGRRHPSTLNTVLSLADLRRERQRFVEARDLLLEAEDDVRATHGEDNPGKLARLLRSRGGARLALGDLDGADGDLRAAHDLLVSLGESASGERIACEADLAALDGARRALEVGDGAAPGGGER